MPANIFYNDPGKNEWKEIGTKSWASMIKKTVESNHYEYKILMVEKFKLEMCGRCFTPKQCQITFLYTATKKTRFPMLHEGQVKV